MSTRRISLAVLVALAVAVSSAAAGAAPAADAGRGLSPVAAGDTSAAPVPASGALGGGNGSWNATFGDGDVTITDAVLLNDTVVAVGSRAAGEDDARAVAYRVTGNGSVVARWTLAGAESTATAVTDGPDGLAVAGYNRSESRAEPWTVGLNGSLAVQWRHRPNTSISTVIRDVAAAGDGFVLAGTQPFRFESLGRMTSEDGWVQWLGPDGTPRRTETYGAPGRSDFLTAVVPTASGLLLAGRATLPVRRYGASAQDDVWLLAVDDAGGVTANRTLAGWYDDSVAAAAAVGDDVVLAGRVAAEQELGLVARVTPDGQREWVRTVAVRRDAPGRAVTALGDGRAGVAFGAVGDAGRDAVVLAFAPDGTLAGGAVAGGPTGEYVGAVTEAGDAALVAGSRVRATGSGDAGWLAAVRPTGSVDATVTEGFPEPPNVTTLPPPPTTGNGTQTGTPGTTEGRPQPGFTGPGALVALLGALALAARVRGAG